MAHLGGLGPDSFCGGLRTLLNFILEAPNGGCDDLFRFGDRFPDIGHHGAEFASEAFAAGFGRGRRGGKGGDGCSINLREISSNSPRKNLETDSLLCL